MKYEAKIKISGKNVRAFYAGLAPESNFKSARASGKILLRKNLYVSIRAKDANVFRAVLNTLTGLLTVIEKNIQVKHGK